MGFVPGITTEIEAFLTPLGAQELMINGIGGITYFSISDESSNYNTQYKLNNNQVFSLGGRLPVDSKFLSVINENTLRSKVFVDNSTETFKKFETEKVSVVLEEFVGDTYTNSSLSTYVYLIDKTDNTSTSSYVLNWLNDLTLPYGSRDNTLWNTTFNNGGYFDTAIGDMNNNNLLLMVIDGSQSAYIDGKTLKITLPYGGGSVDLYGSYINTNRTKNYYDPFFNETSDFLNRFGPNTVLLFCDDIQRPNGDATKSWSTGYNFPNAPFSQGNKSLVNFVASPGFNKDVAVGIAFLDKGVIVIFNNVLYNNYVGRTNDDLFIYNRNVIRRTVANFVCDIPFGSFMRSQNSTFSTGTTIRISSIGLYNANKELVAVGRLSSEIEKNSAQRFTFLVKLVI